MPTIAPMSWSHFKNLANGAYNFGLGGEDSLMHSAQFVWDSALIGTITIWTKVFRDDQVALNDAVAGRWVQQQPASLYVPISPVGSATNTNLTIAIPGGTAGGCEIDLSNFGSIAKAIVTVTTPGEFTYSWMGKH